MFCSLSLLFADLKSYCATPRFLILFLVESLKYERVGHDETSDFSDSDRCLYHQLRAGSAYCVQADFAAHLTRQ